MGFRYAVSRPDRALRTLLYYLKFVMGITLPPNDVFALLMILSAHVIIPSLGLQAAYQALFACTAIFFLAGSILVWRVRKVR